MVNQIVDGPQTLSMGKKYYGSQWVNYLVTDIHQNIFFCFQ